MIKKWFIVLLFLTAFAAHAQDAQTYTDSLGDNAEARDYKITLAGGEAVLITTETQQGDNLDTVLTLYDAQDNVVAMNDDADRATFDSRIAFIAPQAGSYRVNVSRYDSSTSGRYTLTVTTGDPSVLDYNVDLSGPRLTRDSQHFRLHYTQSGADAVEPRFLDAVARAFEDAWHIEIDKLGWPAPPTDTLMGGSSLYDVYLIDLIGTREDALGFTSPELFVGDNPNSAVEETTAATSYIAIDNDFHDIEFEADQDAYSVMRATAIHEFHHAIQFGFDALEPQDWLAEATSSWMETAAGGKDQDATGYVKTAFDYPELCLGTTAEDRSVMYGEWTFMQFLTDEFGDDAVRNLWDEIVSYDGFDALQHLLDRYQTNIPTEVARYRIKNLARDYKLAPLFHATVWLENTITGTGDWTYGTNGHGVQELGANYFDFNAPQGNYDLVLHNNGNLLRLWAIGLTADNLEAIDLGRGGGIDSSLYDKVYLMVFNPTYDNNVDDCSYADYDIEVLNGKGTPNPVNSVWNRTNFEALK